MDTILSLTDSMLIMIAIFMFLIACLLAVLVGKSL